MTGALILFGAYLGWGFTTLYAQCRCERCRHRPAANDDSDGWAA